MKLHVVNNKSEGDNAEQLIALASYFELTDLKNADVIYCGSIDSLEASEQAKLRTHKPLVVYCWDYYLWAHEGKHYNWDWQRYARLMKMADLIIVPSSTQGRRIKELLGLDSVVVRTGIKVNPAEVSDENFILDPVRYYPEENKLWAEQAAEKLGIKFIHSEHKYSFEEFKQLIATCTFMTSCFREASTGGLTLIEGLWHGKPSLTSNSPYQGAGDYLGKFGTYFQYDNFDDLVDKMNTMWTERKKVDIVAAREYITKELSFDTMARNIYDSISSNRVVGK